MEEVIGVGGLVLLSVPEYLECNLECFDVNGVVFCLLSLGTCVLGEKSTSTDRSLRIDLQAVTISSKFVFDEDVKLAITILVLGDDKNGQDYQERGTLVRSTIPASGLRIPQQESVMLSNQAFCPLTSNETSFLRLGFIIKSSTVCSRNGQLEKVVGADQEAMLEQWKSLALKTERLLKEYKEDLVAECKNMQSKQVKSKLCAIM